tara:strand:+ start:90 stop:209 length:120 start_codon:yes stop_codon:yes gene_type:complete
MWFFLAGFISGIYTNQKYKMPNVANAIDRFLEEEKKRRK